MKNDGKRKGLSAGAAALLILTFSASAGAQCAMCRAAVESASNAAMLSRALNIGGLVLLLPPLFLFTAFFVMAWRYARSKEIADSGKVAEYSFISWLRSKAKFTAHATAFEEKRQTR